MRKLQEIAPLVMVPDIWYHITWHHITFTLLSVLLVEGIVDKRVNTNIAQTLSFYGHINIAVIHTAVVEYSQKGAYSRINLAYIINESVCGKLGHTVVLSLGRCRSGVIRDTHII